MRSVVGLGAAVLAAGALAAPAQARQGTGLYAPFPSSPGGAPAVAFAADFGLDVPERRLGTGFALPRSRLRPAAAGPASARAGTAAPDRAGGFLAGLAAALAATTFVLVGAARRR